MAKQHQPGSSHLLPADHSDEELDKQIDENEGNLSNSLTSTAVRHALATISVLNSFSGSIENARSALMKNGSHPAVASPAGLSAPLIPELECQVAEDEAAREELAYNNPGDILDDVDVVLADPASEADLRWDLEDPTDLGGDEEAHQVELDPPVYYNQAPRGSHEGCAQPRKQEEPQGWNEVLLGHFATLYEGMKKGIDMVLADNHEIKAAVASNHTDLRMIRDEQVRLGGILQEVKAQLEAIHTVNTTVQYDMAEIKEEVSICTAGFSKINSALLQMASSSIPVGQLPTLAGYHTPTTSSTVSTDPEGKTTPIAYGDAQLTESLTKTGFPSDKTAVIKTHSEQ